LVMDIETAQKDTFKFVTDYTFAKNGKFLAFASSGSEKNSNSDLHVLNFEKGTLWKVHSAQKAKYGPLTFSESGQALGFVVDEDTTKVQQRPNSLYLWKNGQPIAKKMVDINTTSLAYHASIYSDLMFSEDESKLYFGFAKPQIEKDTLLTEEEIVNVEVWTYNEPRLYTVQEMALKKDSIQSFKAVLHLQEPNLVRPLASSKYPNVELGNKGNASIALLNTSEPYDLQSQWTNRKFRNYALIDINNGIAKEIFQEVSGKINLSPNGSYVYGFDESELAWFAYNIETDNKIYLTQEKPFFDELHDSPSPPDEYGLAGWLKDDKAIIIYDRYDLWKFNPDTGVSERLTNGREEKTVYRYLALDKEKEYLDPAENWLLSIFKEGDKSGGYANYNPSKKKSEVLLAGNFRYRKPLKALLDDNLIYTRESFKEFPDLHLSTANFKKSIKISNANPQQNEYNWGTIELVNWTSLDGLELTGLLVKPEDFNPNKKYPMIVNFYEKSSDRLNYHRAPNPGRSTINYSFYASRGYLIFNPDIYYRTGYPGESAYNCVIPGVTSLIEKGFVDKDHIGVQGHSWGGYQIAHLVTKTDIFKAAEAGAPVPNMISAYGGIRWWTGLSRQFQYEHTQSRIGGTPWEYPMRYIENSPIFNIDKINTPLLIMHNDADGHVPWYQGIEFFVSLRRLGKPSWFINYNDEPHWPLKLQNRKDFNIRLAQFFDHYLKGSPKPSWMVRGVPAIEKGIKQGYDLIEIDDKK
ncbi:MAG: prolyl oligopeptidase family serine peptidase, partial [Eudoraea sp.]|uniref:alpha/beta hydrolase family protein n=1 Tax=Eudoraea sp. TaxID=1979955 RepID=UPI003C74AC9C